MDASTLAAQIVERARRSLRWIWLIAAICLIVTTSAYVAAKAQTPIYSASATLVYEPRLDLETTLGGGSTGGGAIQETMTVGGLASMVSSPPVREGAERALAATAVADGYTVSAAPVFLDSASVSDTVQVTALSSHAGVAALAANAYAASLIRVRETAQRDQIRRAQRIATAQTTRISRGPLVERLTLEQELADLRILGAVVAGDLRVVTPAVPPAAPEKPRPLHTAVLALAVSLIAAVGLALALQEFDTSVGDPREVAEALALPLLGCVPVDRGPAVAAPGERVDADDDAMSDAYRSASARLEWTRAGGDPPARVIVVTSSLRVEGRGGVAAALAEALAQRGRTVAVVDADLRRPSVHARFALPNDHGAIDVLGGRRQVADVLRDVAPASAGTGLVGAGDAAAVDGRPRALLVMTSGPPPSQRDGLVAPAAFRHLCEEMTRRADVVLVCSPETGSTGDAAVIAACADGAVVLVELRRASRPFLAELRRTLASSPCRMLGVLVADR